MYVIEMNSKCRVSRDKSIELPNWDVLTKLEFLGSDIKTILLGGLLTDLEDEGFVDPFNSFDEDIDPFLPVFSNEVAPPKPKYEMLIDFTEPFECFVHHILIDGYRAEGKEYMGYRLFTNKGVFKGSVTKGLMGNQPATWFGVQLVTDTGEETLQRYDQLFNNFK